MPNKYDAILIGSAPNGLTCVPQVAEAIQYRTLDRKLLRRYSLIANISLASFICSSEKSRSLTILNPSHS